MKDFGIVRSSMTQVAQKDGCTRVAAQENKSKGNEMYWVSMVGKVHRPVLDCILDGGIEGAP